MTWAKAFTFCRWRHGVHAAHGGLGEGRDGDAPMAESRGGAVASGPVAFVTLSGALRVDRTKTGDPAAGYGSLSLAGAARGCRA
jgi:hypothetical protein